MKIVYLFNLAFESVALPDAVRQVLDAARAGRKGLVVTPNVDHVVMIQDDDEMRHIYKEALFRYADGMPIVWLSRFVSNNPLPERVTGADLLPAIFEKSAGTGLNIYFLGGNPGIANQAADNLLSLYPGVNIVGTYCPPFGFESDLQENNRIIEDINARNVHILFIGVGTPKQEKWAAAHLDRLQVGPVLCIGAAFDFAAGTIKRAPELVRNAGLEWFWRLASEPRRLWKRYLVRDSKFIPLAWRELTQRKHECPTLAILGTRGIPARHGGFETFAEQLSLYLVSKGWHVTVYCQNNGGEKQYEDDWNGIRLVHIPVRGSDTIGSIIFDWKSTFHVLREKSLVLTLGYNTAIFSFCYRLFGITNLINMDGFEWRRKKWSLFQQCWLYLNERVACKVANHLIADHPEIYKHLQTRAIDEKISMIPYGVDAIENCDVSVLNTFGLQQNKYVLVVARTEPENSILEIIQAYSSKKRGYKLVIVGLHNPLNYPYHAKLSLAAGDEVIFLGAIYDKDVLNSLRRYCRLYIHGHQVGGTNPSLLEAMAASNAILAHDNPFNRWVARNSAVYFKGQRECSTVLDSLLDNTEQLQVLGKCALKICKERFSSEKVMSAYNDLLFEWLGK